MALDGWMGAPEIEPRLTSRLRTSSGTFLVMLQSALADEWEKMTGARLTSKAWCMVDVEVCDKSTMTPSRFISLMTSYQSKTTNTALIDLPDPSISSTSSSSSSSSSSSFLSSRVMAIVIHFYLWFFCFLFGFLVLLQDGVNNQQRGGGGRETSPEININKSTTPTPPPPPPPPTTTTTTTTTRVIIYIQDKRYLRDYVRYYGPASSFFLFIRP